MKIKTWFALTDFRQPFGQKPTLNLGDDFPLMLELISMVLNLPPQPVNGRVGIYTRFHLFGLKRFGHRVYSPQLQTSHLVLGPPRIN
jgi:hypothetical protein